MLFQTEPDPLIVDSYSTAWEVADFQYPGKLGPVRLPVKVEFYVLDETKGIPRETGPFPVEFGQIIEVTQKNKADAPKVSISGEAQPDGQIKTTNMKGNAQPLEMALYKNGSKIVSFKNVPPADAVNLALNPVIYIADIDGKGVVQGQDFKAVVQAAQSTPFSLYQDKPDVYLALKPVIYITDIDDKGVVQGQDFKAVVQAAQSTPFSLYPDKPDVNIGIEEKQSGELD